MEEEGGRSSRPLMGFPLGLALLVVMLLCMSCLFTCFYHWHKLRSLFIFRPSMHENYSESPRDSDSTAPHSPPKYTAKEEPTQGPNLTVVMPGDQFPKFVALPTPCQTYS
ncbi:uncharacterized protein At5g65660-like [Rhododendron vialii]|uniref:uncharacterized protein At5g65660-like n=1 Tax=Rhododendron vialii TaxID=182163 RepID=UPI00265F38BE|nr:uncharacterized protein At5g65660-like [Rhododendron vialii]